MDPGPGQKSMKKLAVAVAATVLVSALATAQQAAQPASAQAPPAPPELATSHPSTKLGPSTRPVAGPPTKAASGASTALPVDAQNQLVKQYCAGCHSDRGKAGGLTLASFDAATIEEHGDVAEKMIRKLRTGMMPPPNARRPEAAVVQSFIDTLENKIDAAAALNPNPGWRPFQRLNRAEYQRAVRDLVGIDVDVTAFLPPDTISRGFDNVADVQNFSPTLMESYLRAASQISRLAVGDRNASPTSVTYKIGRTASQMRHVEGAPMGTRGGTSVVHTFPADGDYVIKMSMHNEPLGGIYGRTSMATLDVKEQVEVSINGERAALLDLNVRMSETDPKNSLEIKTPPIHIAAGPQRVSAAFIQRFDGPLDDLLVPLENTLADVNISFGVTALPHMRDMTILGPSSVTGVSDTVSRRMIFTCRATTAKEEETCAADIVKRLTAQAYRGAATPDDLQDAMLFYEQGRKKGDFESGIRMALQSILVSPRFLFRLEQAPPDVKALKAARTYRVSDQDLASRLSFFLWGTIPDAELIKAASLGTLRTPPVLEKQVRRMLADRRSEALATRFAGQWLRLQDLEKIHPDYLLYPQYDDTLAQAMQRETELFFDSLVREDRPVLDLLTADYTFVNERLAKHYNIPNVTGNAFRRVQTPEYRRGIFGHGSILTLTSVADRTSPVQRGKWVMEVLLGSPPPPPPPNVPLLDDVKAAIGGKMLSTRERMEEHRKNPACTSCHRVIDPLGLALENFDATGAWRIKDNEVPVDSVGDLYDGTRMEGPAGLRQAIVKHADVFLLSFTENLMTYALGRRVEYADMPAIRAIIHDAGRNSNRMSSFVLGVVNSTAFRMANAEHHQLTTDAGEAKRSNSSAR
jgi:mono/diheme cytochrome c family protein